MYDNTKNGSIYGYLKVACIRKVLNINRRVSELAYEWKIYNRNRNYDGYASN